MKPSACSFEAGQASLSPWITESPYAIHLPMLLRLVAGQQNANIQFFPAEFGLLGVLFR